MMETSGILPARTVAVHRVSGGGVTMMPRIARPIAVGAGLAGLAGLTVALTGCAGEVTDHSYRDGSYTASAKYLAPSGTEQIDVEVRLQDDVITSLTVTPHAYDRNAARFQQQFVGQISDAVVGEDIDLLAVARVAGSSLTSGGFNTALAEIKDQAVE
jgi:uncharacterized protein with FMN-binding domain